MSHTKLEKIELVEEWDIHHEDFESDFEIISSQYKNIFKEERMTLQNYTFTVMVCKNERYFELYETLPLMEEFKISFLAWQNVNTPEVLFSENESNISLSVNFSHSNDVTWEMLDVWIKMRVNSFNDNSFPMTVKEDAKHRSILRYRDESSKLSKMNLIESSEMENTND